MGNKKLYGYTNCPLKVWYVMWPTTTTAGELRAMNKPTAYTDTHIEAYSECFQKLCKPTFYINDQKAQDRSELEREQNVGRDSFCFAICPDKVLLR